MTHTASFAFEAAAAAERGAPLGVAYYYFYGTARAVSD